MNYGVKESFPLKSPIIQVYNQTMEKSNTQNKKLETLIFNTKVPENHTVIYHGYLEQLRQGAYELFIDLYKQLRTTKCKP
jgi:hypothetical protein